MTVLWSLAWGAATVLLVVWIVRTLNWAWREPRRLERALRAQGLDGSPYRFPFGDVKENNRLLQEVRAKPMPLHSHDIIPRLLPVFHRHYRQYGKISFNWVGPMPRVNVMDPDLIKEVLSSKFREFERPSMNPFGKYFIKGLASYDGDKWFKHRKILNPAFSLEKLKGMLPAFFACASEMVSRWERKLGSEGWCEIDALPEFHSLTVDAISRAAFGSSYELGKRIHQLQTEQGELLVQVSQNLFIPGYSFLPTRKKNRIIAIDREIREILGGIIKNREEEMKLGKPHNGDMLGLLMESNMKYYQEQGNKNAGMTKDEVMEECKLFYFAGQETTSVLLTWTMVMLSMYPSWQVRAREEVLQVFGEKTPDFDGLGQLKIVTMILYEVLRLYPPALFVHRYTTKATKLGDITCPPGVIIALLFIFAQHDPDIWGNDSKEFNPDRFKDGISKASNDNYAFLAFGGGPRICIGQNFSMLEAKLALCMILQRFTFELSPSYVHAPKTLITLQPQHGAQIKLRGISMSPHG
ncbi:cytochrome P450 72A397-like [Zingiber officinale]|uniref:cytochrome P450 72A397-like n=1 Tax=Zingiber officinale TaxID=94328 RepID=UPI001C4B7044|nr:cytochrome P450 72A397-like [Zingiber officinale]